ncbi:MAG TPA: hypothetical protein VFB52_07135 [Solirubrobacterales bacterium]|nr:hypothetical protein [Solirubrobacterales bacterium]
MLKYLLTVSAVALAALSLAACGGSDSDSDEDQITTAIETSVTTTDPADCTVYSTQAFLEQSEGEKGEAAVTSCEEDVEDTSDDPDSVEVSAVEVDGDAATAEVAFSGGGFDGQAVAVSLVKEDGDWKLDSIDGFAEFDRDAFVGSLEEGFATTELTDEQTSCVNEAFDAATDEELEAVILEGEEALIEIVADC